MFLCKSALSMIKRYINIYYCVIRCTAVVTIHCIYFEVAFLVTDHKVLCSFKYLVEVCRFDSHNCYSSGTIPTIPLPFVFIKTVLSLAYGHLKGIYHTSDIFQEHFTVKR